ncbi:MAG: threonylcarbamoyl-AMP synthase [Armatimonadetes bacterium CG2_30_59_28]|nr:threonylcarbamoyl-AMP synthase [Armatimonadota bacterium]OIO94039.1 MAG: threonylcarbamoyl-AMP synthase [Armatimonadetes bacterium CG2_30_59_28]PIU62026.1 MAG: threonylcarbamoyl-AMP synthase [Armatimonadetes bacterium CG07_land_8_20_14_0_80_59_28]PIX44550.1 MAG: threonylcarbamoyl-AMP synthase [Armatimonadetes bacterium CG_4_8_14_3_um_filter_58_9]PIY48807.1 MAG: threonylcarbamoyl-AMP synthase [Armatimonadetes bacterium CG_4_10_14_3_um_filter_59_10]PJB63305.1 MAG: threonylcarbamoyl-AMP syntha
MATIIALRPPRDGPWDDAFRQEYLQSVLAPAVEAIAVGGVVIVPTETVYGMAANALDEVAANRIFSAKGRASDVPLPVQVASVDDVCRYVIGLDDRAERLMRRLMPGPLTLVLRKSDVIPDVVTAGNPTLGIRIPDHRVTLEFLHLCGGPLIMSSANRSGEPPVRTGAQARRLFGEVVDVIIDGDPHSEFGCREPAVSTVVDLTRTPPVVLREGSVPMNTLREFLPDLVEMSECGKPTSFSP